MTNDNEYPDGSMCLLPSYMNQLMGLLGSDTVVVSHDDGSMGYDPYKITIPRMVS